MTSPLDRLLRLHEQLERQSRAALGMAARDLDALRDNRARLEAALLPTVGEERSVAGVATLSAALEANQRAAELANRREDERRRELEARAMERRQVERLKERRRRAEARKSGRKEQRHLDDWAAGRGSGR